MWHRAAVLAKNPDVLLPVVIGATGLVDIAASVPPEDVSLSLAALAGTVAATAARRRHPHLSALTVLACLGFATFVASPLNGTWPALAVAVALYSVARHVPPVEATPELALGLLYAVAVGAQAGNDSVAEFVANVTFVSVLVIGVPWAAGAALHRRELTAEAATAAAASQERMRIARDLHDVVGHSLAVIAVQAGAERATLPPDAPQSTQDTLTAIERTTREALDEMRRLVAVLRSSESPVGSRPPQPSLADLDRLVEQVGHAGLDVTVDVDGEPQPLPAGMELTVYRMVQESLTNVLRHSGGAHAHVGLVYSPHELLVKVTDDGRARAGRTVTGHGLAGMRERVELYGGSLELSDDGRGLTITARLPVPERLP